MFNRLCNLPKSHSFFLFGPRQTGKTTLIKSILNERDFSVDLLKSDVYFSYKKDPSLLRREIEKKIRENNLKRVFVDEIQRVPELLNEIHYLIEQYNCQFILTGSSARKLNVFLENEGSGRS